MTQDQAGWLVIGWLLMLGALCWALDAWRRSVKLERRWHQAALESYIANFDCQYPASMREAAIRDLARLDARAAAYFAETDR